VVADASGMRPAALAPRQVPQLSPQNAPVLRPALPAGQVVGVGER
jgi:hypothetical protein